MRIDQSLSSTLEAVSHAPAQTSTPKTQSNNETPSLMPEIARMICNGDPGAMMAALTMQTAKNESDTSRKMRDAAMSAQAKADAAAVQDMHDKANVQRAQGFFDGAMQIGQGVCDLGAGLNEAHQASEQAAAAADEADIKENGKSYSKDHIDALQDSANTLNRGAANSKTSAAWDHFGASAFGAARSIGDGLFNGAIADKDADGKMHDASSATFKRIADDAHDNENDAKTLLNKALDFYKEYVDTKNQTAMAAIHRA